MIKKKAIAIFSVILLVFITGFAVVYNYLDTRLLENSIRIVRAQEGVFNSDIIPFPEGIEIITEEEFMLTVEEEARELTDVHVRQYIEKFFNANNTTAEFFIGDALDERLVFACIDDYIYERPEISARIYNVLFIGDDARIHQDRGRSNAMILLSYNRDTRIISLTSFMRDILVPINPDGTYWNRLNSMHATGGPGRTINLINRLFSLNIQRYVAVRFSGVFELVDALGGLELELTGAEAAVINRIFPDFDPVCEGLNHLNGRQVLAYSRMRVIDSDFVRTQRQRYVMRAIIDKILDTTNISDIFTLAAFALDHVETNIPLNEILTIVWDMFSGSRPVIEELRIPVVGSFNHGLYYGAYILIIDFTENITALHKHVYGSAAGARIPNFTLPYITQPIQTAGNGEFFSAKQDNQTEKQQTANRGY